MRRARVHWAIMVSLLSATVVVTRAQAHGQAQPMPASETSAMHAPAPQAGSLQITFGGKSAAWTATTLAALPHKTITVHNEHTNADETYSGVVLIDLLTPLGVNPKPRGKDLKLYVLAAGSDGYEVVYSIGEITPDVSNATVIVADSKDGKNLAGSGPLQLVATGENRPARWVHNLVSLRVMTAE
jgi:hypothetical protein